MPLPLITSALSQAGVRLLNTLIDLAQEYGDRTGDDTLAVIIEHWARDVQTAANLNGVFDSAQDQFTGHDSPHAHAQSKWLEAFAALIEYGGEDVPVFMVNLWRTYFFRLAGASDVLWNDYLDLQRSVAIRTDRKLPASWGDWIIPMQTFMGIAEGLLIEQVGAFGDLLTSQDVVDLLEDLQPERARPDPFAEGTTTFIPGSQFDATATLLAYLSACVEHIGQVDPRGLPQVSRAAIPLDEVYIPLKLVPISAFGSPGDTTRYRTATNLEPQPYLFYEATGRAELDSQPDLLPQEALYHHPQALILGEVGTGKTTLLRHLTLEAARGLLDDQQGSLVVEHDANGGTHVTLKRPLPVFVDLAEFVDCRGPEEDLESFILRSAAEMVGDQGVVPMLARLLEGGHCLLLLDGLDRAATDEQRRTLLESVSHAAIHWRARGNRIAISSRLAGYGSTPLAETFAAFIIRPMDRSQIGPFVLRWSLAITRLRHPLIRDDEALQHAQSATLALVRELTHSPQLGVLASTPQMLRLLAGIYRPGMLLTPQRVAIYQMAADALIHDWRLPQTAANHPTILEHEVTHLLSHLAYWIHVSRPAGKLSGPELQAILSHIWHQLHPDSPAERGKSAIEDFIGRLNPGSGVLVELVPGQYGFADDGLQEYFAARYLVSSYRLASERIRSFLHDPRWDEVIRLAIGFTALRSQEDASDLIETGVLARGARATDLGHQPSPFEGYLRRDLFFAARLLSSGAEARPEVVQAIVHDLVTLWLNGDRDSLGRFSLIFDAAHRHLARLDGAQAGLRAMQIVLEHLDAPDEHVRAFAIDAVTFWPGYAAGAIERVATAGRDASPLVRRAAAQALGHVGNLPVEAYKLLLSLVNDTDDQVAQAARAALHHAEPVPQEALSTVVDWLRGSTPAARRVGLRQLQQVGALPPSVVAELIHLLNDPEQDIRHGAIEALASATHLPENALLTLCRLAMDTASGLRLGAINALRRPAELPNEVIEHLVDWTYDPEVSIRRAAALALGACLNHTPEVIDALIERLDDPVDSVRAEVAEPLAHKGRGDPRVMHVLAHAVRDPTHRVRCAVAAALSAFPEPDADLRMALKLLVSDQEMIVRETALDTIAKLSDPGLELIDQVVMLVRMPDLGIAARAVRALAALENLPQPALQALVSALPVHWGREGKAISACLRAHYPLGIDLINQIMDLAVLRSVGRTQAGRLPDGLRALALEILGYGLEEAPDIIGVLQEAALDATSSEVQIAALRGLAHSRTMWREVRSIMLRLLKEGPLPVRCAAGTALGQLLHTLPNPSLSADEMATVATALAGLLKEITPRASWEPETKVQNDLLRALNQVVARSRPTPPRLAARLETQA